MINFTDKKIDIEEAFKTYTANKNMGTMSTLLAKLSLMDNLTDLKKLDAKDTAQVFSEIKKIKLSYAKTFRDHLTDLTVHFNFDSSAVQTVMRYIMKDFKLNVSNDNEVLFFFNKHMEKINKLMPDSQKSLGSFSKLLCEQIARQVEDGAPLESKNIEILVDDKIKSLLSKHRIPLDGEFYEMLCKNIWVYIENSTGVSNEKYSMKNDMAELTKDVMEMVDNLAAETDLIDKKKLH